MIRGAPGSGKTFLANLIHKEERSHGNDRSLVLRAVNKDQDGLICKFRDVVEEDLFRFIIVEIDGGRLLYFNKIVHIATTLARNPFQCFAIEISQTREVCLKFNINNSPENEIDSTIRDLANFRSPISNLIDATSLLVEHRSKAQLSDLSSQYEVEQDKMQKKQTDVEGVNEGCSTSFPAENVLKVKDWIQDDSVMQLVQRMNNEMQVVLQDDRPICTPLKIVDYLHVHALTFQEQLSAFRIHKMYEYRHKPTSSYTKFIENVDLDKIKSKRKVIATRRKILQHLKVAERPEDTVSNPKYPNNWETIKRERPVRRNKRKKLSGIKVEDAKKAHFVKCFTNQTQNQMDLEDFSSDEEFSNC